MGGGGLLGVMRGVMVLWGGGVIALCGWGGGDPRVGVSWQLWHTLSFSTSSTAKG